MNLRTLRSLKWKQTQHSKMKNTVMKTKHNLLSKISLRSGFAVALAFAVWLPGAARTAEQMKGAEHLLHLQHITTRAQAEALKPGDSMAMTCTKCKDVMVQKVTTDKAHVKMMTVGEKLKCSCGGNVEVVATGKGSGKNAEVKHVCSKCGDDAMFCTATKPGSGAMKDMDHEKK
jgi:hypothetical protein